MVSTTGKPVLPFRPQYRLEDPSGGVALRLGLGQIWGWGTPSPVPLLSAIQCLTMIDSTLNATLEAVQQYSSAVKQHGPCACTRATLPDQLQSRCT